MPARPTGTRTAGDVCDSDRDRDGIDHGTDNCSGTGNADQAHADGDGAGDTCTRPHRSPTPALIAPREPPRRVAGEPGPGATRKEPAHVPRPRLAERAYHT